MWRAAGLILAIQVVWLVCGCKEWHEAAYDYYQNATDFRGSSEEKIYIPQPAELPGLDHPDSSLNP
jgi:hypothetical protein